MKGATMAIKRAADFVTASVALILLAPLFLVLALAIKIASPGPVFFRQARLGQGGRVFRIFKFRTMHHNAPVLKNEDGSTYTGKDDPRIFALGTKLRKYSLDELPQLINVVLGDMSIVGPRPDMEEHRAQYSEEQARKLLVKPGITGWAMVNGRNTIPWEKRIELDIWYIDNHSLWLDLKTALMTLPVLAFGKGVNQK
jgi:undecaprenyl phosphate N,N'-diacetylbacillosamine 1-phosphate transferase